MNKGKLETLWTSVRAYSVPPSAPFNNLTWECYDPVSFCPWGAKIKYSYSRLNVDTLNAVLAICGGNEKLALIKTNGSTWTAEEQLDSGDILVVTATERGNIRAGIKSPSKKWTALPEISRIKHSCAAIHAVLLALIAWTPNYVDDTDSVKIAVQVKLNSAKNDYDPTAPYNGLKVSDLYYFSDTLEKGAKMNILKSNIEGGNIQALPESSLSSLAGECVCGEPVLINNTKSRVNVRAETFGDAMARKEFVEFRATRRWTAEEEELIPRFDGDYPVAPEAVTLALRYIRTRNDRRPMRNFLWRGITAYGKSTGVEQMAALLHTPLVRITCSSNMEAQEFLSNFVPDPDTNGVSVVDTEGLPSFLDLATDPEGAYRALTGKEKPGASCEDAFAAYTTVVATAGRKYNGSARFKLVESAYVRGLKNGYIVEVQEMSRIKDAGTMVTLNEYDRPGALIPLVDGSFARRHEDAIVIYTDNFGYSSCRPVDPSVLRRMDCVITSDKLDDARVKARIVYNTGCTDMVLVNNMLKVWKDLIKYCKENEIRTGEISPNELERWVALVQHEGEDTIVEAAMETMISKVSPDVETMNEIKHGCLYPSLSKNHLR